jgi:hypothetical protein
MSAPAKSVEAVTKDREERWLEENREGFEAFARFVEKNGIFNEEDREWWAQAPDDTLQRGPPPVGLEK